jgi:AraC family transcriptional regulator
MCGRTPSFYNRDNFLVGTAKARFGCPKFFNDDRDTLPRYFVRAPARTTAAAFPRYLNGEILADSESLGWAGLYVRRWRFSRVVDRLLVPATAEPHISCNVAGSAEFLERDPGGNWITRQIRPGDSFVTRSRTPYEVSFRSPPGEELESISMHVGVEPFRAALEAVYPGKADQVEVIDFFGRDAALNHMCATCAELLNARVRGSSKVIADLTHLLAAYLAEKYTTATPGQREFRGGLPIRRLQKVAAYITEHLAEQISVQALAQLVELSPFHFSRVFKQTTGMTPHQFVTRERITRAQQLTRETSRSLIEIALEVGYSNPSHFAKVFRKVAGVTPTEFRSAL